MDSCSSISLHAGQLDVILPSTFSASFFFRRIHLGIPVVSNSSSPISPDVLSVEIWAQTICTGYKQVGIKGNKSAQIS